MEKYPALQDLKNQNPFVNGAGQSGFVARF